MHVYNHVTYQMEGEESVENCEIVSFGHGTRLTLMGNMVDDGTVIDDCTGKNPDVFKIQIYTPTRRI